jgi:hypothetical protein
LQFNGKLPFGPTQTHVNGVPGLIGRHIGKLSRQPFGHIEAFPRLFGRQPLPPHLP